MIYHHHLQGIQVTNLVHFFCERGWLSPYRFHCQSYVVIQHRVKDVFSLSSIKSMLCNVDVLSLSHHWTNSLVKLATLWIFYISKLLIYLIVFIYLIKLWLFGGSSVSFSNEHFCLNGHLLFPSNFGNSLTCVFILITSHYNLFTSIRVLIPNLYGLYLLKHCFSFRVINGIYMVFCNPLFFLDSHLISYSSSSTSSSCCSSSFPFFLILKRVSCRPG